MHPTIKKLLDSKPVITDGAWGTQMQKQGLTAGMCPDEWNLSHPAEVREVAAAYVKSGSRVILTNTFGANSITLKRYGLADKVAEINHAGAAISCAAAKGSNAMVFASIGPTGAMLITGDVTETELSEAYSRQAAALAEGGANGIVVETMTDLAEAKIAVVAAKKTGLPVVVCMVFDSGADGQHTMMGISPEQAAAAFGQIDADVVGANCGKGIDAYSSLCKRIRAATDKPVWVKPNAGAPQVVNGKTVYISTPKDFAANLRHLMDAGASFVGGCCGTGPEFIAALSKSIKTKKQK
jgi:methionine synthase I (cobalamin-dependent)